MKNKNQVFIRIVEPESKSPFFLITNKKYLLATSLNTSLSFKSAIYTCFYCPQMILSIYLYQKIFIKSTHTQFQKYSHI